MHRAGPFAARERGRAYHKAPRRRTAREPVSGVEAIWLRTCFLAETAGNKAQKLKMASGWHPDEDTTPTPREVEMMAGVLEGRHGLHAAEVAEFLSTFHEQRRDAARAWAWAGVAECVRQREQVRLMGR
jgi:hypothetical protein